MADLDRNRKLIQEAQNPAEESEWAVVFQQIIDSIVCLTPDAKINNLIVGSESLLLLAILDIARRRVKSSKIELPEAINLPKRLTKDARSAINALANTWYQKLILCEQLHSQTGTRYRNAAHWFSELVIEERCNKIKARSSGREIRRGKKELAKIIQAKLNKLRDRDNPQNPESREESPHYWLLLEKALQEKNHSDNFSEKYWPPFLSSIVAWKNELKANPALASAFTDEDGELSVQHGQGRAKIRPSQNLSAESRSGKGFQQLSSNAIQRRGNVQF